MELRGVLSSSGEHSVGCFFLITLGFGRLAFCLNEHTCSAMSESGSLCVGHLTQSILKRKGTRSSTHIYEMCGGTLLSAKLF